MKLREAIRPILVGGTVAGLAHGSLVAAGYGVLNGIQTAPPGELLVLVLGCWLTGVGMILPVSVLVGLAAWVIAGRGARVRPDRFGRWTLILAGLASVASFAWILIGNYQIVRKLMGGPTWGRDLGTFLAAAAVILLFFFTAARRPRGAIVAGLLVAGSLVVVAAPGGGSVHGPSAGNPDPGEGNPADPGDGTEGAPDGPKGSGRARQRVLLLALDGLDPVLFEAFAAEGKLPNLERLRRSGAWGRLATIWPTRSPAIWTTVATGLSPAKHGITNFTTLRLPWTSIQLTERVRDIGHKDLFDFLAWLGVEALREVPIGSGERLAKALWNVAADNGRKVVVLNWWATWPAEEVDGWIVSDRVSYFYHRKGPDKGARIEPAARLTHPGDLFARIAPLIVSPANLEPADVRRFLDVDDEEAASILTHEWKRYRLAGELGFLVALDWTYRAIALRAFREVPDADLFVLYLRGIDVMEHCAMKFMDRLHDPTVTEVETRKFGRAVERYYEETDRMVGELASAAGDGAVILVLSDHGFEKEGPGLYNHTNAPAGVILASGPGVRAGVKIEGASVLDVLPTVVSLLDLPLARDLEGNVIGEIARPLAPIIASYGPPVRPAWGKAEERAGTAVDAEIRERLRALGYLQ